MWNRLNLTLDQAEYSALLKVALAELRSPVDQAHHMLRQELIRRGMLDSAGYGLQEEPPQWSVPTRSEQNAP